MRGKNGRFTKKDNEEDSEIENIKTFEYTDLWVYKVVDAFTRALVGLLLRLAIQIFFILLFAMLLKKIGILDVFKEIIGMIYEMFSIAKSFNGGKSDEYDSRHNESNSQPSHKGYFS